MAPRTSLRRPERGAHLSVRRAPRTSRRGERSARDHAVAVERHGTRAGSDRAGDTQGRAEGASPRPAQGADGRVGGVKRERVVAVEPGVTVERGFLGVPLRSRTPATRAPVECRAPSRSTPGVSEPPRQGAAAAHARAGTERRMGAGQAIASTGTDPGRYVVSRPALFAGCQGQAVVKVARDGPRQSDPLAIGRWSARSLPRLRTLDGTSGRWQALRERNSE